ncbi:hypothetical protein AVEN_119647-1 [Araneus ventricosus]|uniref:Uncharacterized protein n=1 Tax=Araneus ventricosus TaxID=182803 RepID=A0A4Y2TTX2_ARAVE|nr:hypothetical protein AVEN_22892-1 [Araneus ventricosus]GBO02636.1 hypothetical protein AVEN_264430-1 [Araneus ventricosus]GBO02689.1 hypothetical protein AVEN_119647-1 [Araneus ventricosus]
MYEKLPYFSIAGWQDRNKATVTQMKKADTPSLQNSDLKSFMIFFYPLLYFTSLPLSFRRDDAIGNKRLSPVEKERDRMPKSQNPSPCILIMRILQIHQTTLK